MKKNTNWQYRILWFLGVTPIVVAWTMAATGWGIPSTTKNHGELLSAGLQVPQNLTALHRGRWGLLLMSENCAEPCKEQLLLMQQVHKSLGKEFNRLQSIWLNSDGHELFPAQNADTNKTMKNREVITSWFVTKNLPVGDNSIWLIDPEGNLVLRFVPGIDGKGMLADIRWLLKVSRLG